MSFGSTLDSKTIDFSINVSLGEGAGLSVSMSIPDNIFDINAYSLGAVTYSFDVGDELKVAISGTYTKSICIKDFIGSKEKTNKFINSRWKPEQYINIQEGSIKSGEIQSDWWSAQWKFK